MMTTRPATSPDRHARMRRLVRVIIVSAALALTASPFAHPAIARADFNQDFYTFCMNDLGQGKDYCCAHAGGTVNGGKCLDEAGTERLPSP